MLFHCLCCFQVRMMFAIGDYLTVSYLVTSLVVGYYIIFLVSVWYSKTFTNLPPCNYGRIPIPFIGCAFEFGKEPLMFVRKMQEKVSVSPH